MEKQHGQDRDCVLMSLLQARHGLVSMISVLSTGPSTLKCSGSCLGPRVGAVVGAALGVAFGEGLGAAEKTGPVEDEDAAPEEVEAASDEREGSPSPSSALSVLAPKDVPLGSYITSAIYCRRS